MMWRATVVLLLLAALSGAPSRVSAGGNDLADPTVTPASGSTLAIFTFRVRYDGKFPATTVTVAVAGLDLPMALANGSMTAGTWVASSTLPAGAWATSFIAYAERGNVATVTGPAITVTPPRSATPAPAAPGTPGPKGGDRQTDASREGVPVAGPTPPQVPAPAQPASSTVPQPVVTSPSPPDGAVPTAPAVPATGQPPVGGPAPMRSAASSAESPTTFGVVASHAPMKMARPTAVATGDGVRAGDAAEQGTPILTLIGLLGVGAVALVGTAILIARRRRADDDEEPIATTAAALERRNVRRARLRMDEDPIMAAMGIGAEDERRARRRPPPIGEDQS